jgi:uncharacterized membrane protein
MNAASIFQKHEKDRKADEEPVVQIPPLSFAREVMRYVAGSFLLVGIIIIVIGLYLTFSPECRDNPNRLSEAELATGIGVMVIGLMPSLLGVWLARR